MGMMVDGRWHVKEPPSWQRADAAGNFIRSETAFRGWISADGGSGFKAEAGRYHLYVSWACPWAHRTLIMRALKGLNEAIGVSVVDYLMGENGWEFSDRAGASLDSVNRASYLYQIYERADPAFSGRVSVPVLWDKATNTIVNNESREIIRMLDTAFEAVRPGTPQLYPKALRQRIDSTIDAIYEPINNGVYRCGFAHSQGAYDAALAELFEALDHWEAVLGRQRYLCGAGLTEADLCLFTTLIRFDAVYHTHFKCNRRRIVDYPNLWGYLRDLFQIPEIGQTVNLDHIRGHYYASHESINPSRIVAAGPELDLSAPHGREQLNG